MVWPPWEKAAKEEIGIDDEIFSFSDVNAARVVKDRCGRVEVV